MSRSEPSEGRSGASFLRIPPWGYDLMYKRGAPWESGPRSELVGLVEDGTLPAGRSIDLGCGSGANVVFLAQHGFDATGVDFSPVALDKARSAAADAGVASETRWIRADLTTLPPASMHGAFDLVLDYGTLDDMSTPGRMAMARTITVLTRPGGKVLLFCFYAHPEDLPLMSFDGPSRISGTVRPGEEGALFDRDFEIERLPEPGPETDFACFLMTRRV